MCFFKQKTGYEVRIVVWSSDVCSSDLNCGADSGRRQRDLQTDKAVRCRDNVHGNPLRSLIVQGSWDAAMQRVKSGREPFGASPVITGRDAPIRSEEHTSELQSLMRISYAVFCLKKKKNK